MRDWMKLGLMGVVLSIFAWGLNTSAQVERNDPHKMWLLRTTAAPHQPVVFYYKFQAGKIMKCVAVFQVYIPGEYKFSVDNTYGPAVALTSQEVPCE